MNDNEMVIKVKTAITCAAIAGFGDDESRREMFRWLDDIYHRKVDQLYDPPPVTLVRSSSDPNPLSAAKTSFIFPDAAALERITEYVFAEMEKRYVVSRKGRKNE